VRELTANSAPPDPSWIRGDDHLYQREGKQKMARKKERQRNERKKESKERQEKMGVNIPRINSWLCLAHTYCK